MDLLHAATCLATTGLPSSVCVVDCAIDGFIGDQISFSKGDALVSKNRIKWF